MKLIVRITAALALLAIATPALPCGAHQTTATNDAKKQQPVAKADAKKAPAKAEKKATTVKVARPAPETKTAAAQ